VIIIVDSDALIGSLYPQDQHYKNSLHTRLKLAKNNARLIYPATVIVETTTFLQGRLNKPDLAKQVIQFIRDINLVIEPVDKDLLQLASTFMDFKKSKHNTLFDAIVAAIAQKYKADAIFSFDKFYKSRGFKLASEL
jgi:predicted nucleic acid-binding protein